MEEIKNKNETKTTISKLINFSIKNYGTVRGILKLSKNNNIFKLYGMQGNKSFAECKFDKNMLAKAKSVLGKEIAIYGRCIYKSDTIFPYKIIKISDIDDREHGLSEMIDKTTGNRSTLEWIDEARGR